MELTRFAVRVLHHADCEGMKCFNYKLCRTLSELGEYEDRKRARFLPKVLLFIRGKCAQIVSSCAQRGSREYSENTFEFKWNDNLWKAFSDGSERDNSNQCHIKRETKQKKSTQTKYLNTHMQKAG